MARGGFDLLCLLAVFSASTRPGCCQYQQIVLGDTATCNMSTIYSQSDGTSLNCTGAMNGNTDTHWYPKTSNKPNCVFTDNGHWPAYWFLNLGQSRTIHRITIYYVQYQGFDNTGTMRKVQVSVDGREVFTYPDATSLITNPTEMTSNFPVTGQIIKIERTTRTVNNFLQLCEVQIWECKRDRYGKNCTNTCSANCQDNGGKKPCDAISGACNQGCKAGRYGSLCDKQCSDKCRPENNGNITCRQNDGRCTAGCISGWRGPTCTLHCAMNCEGGCDQDNGECNGCILGYYGVRCQSQCGKGCVKNNCNKQNGACACLTGWSAPNCSECQSGYYGVDSCEECGYCRDDDVCNNTNGHCPRGCRDNFDGDRCEKCQVGYYYGVGSCEECGHCLPGDVCDKHNGHCLHGCRDGFDGELCDRCARGYYGVTCQLLCGKGCVNNNCSRQDGACTCLIGWSPPYCVVTASESSGTQDGGDIVGPVVGGLLGAGTLIGLSILLAAIIRRQRSRDSPTSRDSDERREAQFSPEDAQARVDTEGLKTDTSDADNHYESLEKYENPDDIKPYSTLEASHGRRTNVNIQGDKEAVLYHNVTGDKT